MRRSPARNVQACSKWHIFHGWSFAMSDPRYAENLAGPRRRTPSRPPPHFDTKSVIWSVAAGIFAAIVLATLAHIFRVNGIA
jgi:hypothetical protein